MSTFIVGIIMMALAVTVIGLILTFAYRAGERERKEGEPATKTCAYKNRNPNKPFERETQCGYWINYSHRSEWKYCPFCSGFIIELDRALQ